MVAVKIIKNGQEQRPLGALLQRAGVEVDEIAAAQPQNAAEGLKTAMDGDEMENPTFEIVIPAFVGPSIPAQALDDDGKTIACYELSITVRATAADMVHIFSAVNGHKVGLKFVSLKEDGL